MRYIPKNYNFFDEMFSFLPKEMNMNSVMKTDVYEKDGYYNMEIDLPGYDKNDVNLEIMNGYLNIKASHNVTNEEKDEKGNLIRSERSFGSCARSFYIGENIKAEDIKAKFNNGVLNIVMPSKEQKAIETKQSVTIE